MRLRGPVLAAVVSAVVAALVLLVLVLPKASEVNGRKKDLQQAQQQTQSLRIQVAELKQAQRGAGQVRRKLARLSTEIPPTADLPEFIRLLQSAADHSAVDFMSVSPGAPSSTSTTTFSVVPTQITVAGTFFAVDEFMFRLETLPRAMKITNVTIGAGPAGLPQLELAISAELYTTDVSAGPGSVPGPTQPGAVPTPGA